MTTNDPLSCPDCGTLLPADSPQQLCPSCLLKQAFATRTIEPSPQPATPPPSPEEIADKFPQFEITECLGRGGMGVVYKARQKSLNRWVAIKILAPEKIHDEKFAERFTREAQTLALLNHPNIVTVHDYGETDGLFYIVMEFVDGVNLRDLLRDGKIESTQALTIVPPICEALQYAHDKGIVHRDIKPENLLIDRDGRVKIADFGIASLVGDTDEKSGTPPYMAPEQGNHGNVDHRADIYALGAVLYEMLTGDRPASPLDLPSQKVQLDIRIDDIVLRALSKEPERRYRTASEFRTVVENITPENTQPAAHPSAPPLPTTPYSRKPIGLAVAAFVVALLLATVTIPIAFLWLSHSEPPVTFAKTAFQVSHPESLAGNSLITLNVRQGRETNWTPSTGQALTLKDGREILFRCRAAADLSGRSEAFFATSLNGTDWDTEHRTLTEGGSQTITLGSGLTCTIKSSLGPSPDPPKKRSPFGPFAFVLLSLTLVLVAFAWLIKSVNAWNEVKQSPDSSPSLQDRPKRGMFRRWWWVLLIMIPLGTALGLGTALLVGYISPKQYQSSTVIQVHPSGIQTQDVRFFDKQMERVISSKVLKETAASLDLPNRWLQSEEEVLKRLPAMITVSQIQGTDLMEITVKATNPQDAANMANTLAQVLQQHPGEARILTHELAIPARVPLSIGRKTLLLAVPASLLLSPFLGIVLMALLHRLIPDRSLPKAAPELTEEQKTKNATYGKFALWLFLAGTLGTLAMMTLSSNHLMALIFGGVALFLSLVFGLMSRRRGVIIALIVIVILGAVLAALSAFVFYFRMSSAQNVAKVEEQRARSAAQTAESTARDQAEKSKIQEQPIKGLSFGPTIIREISAPISRRENCFLDLDTGKLIDVPAELYPLVKHRFNAAVQKPIDVDRKISAWAQETGADLMISMTDPATALALYNGNMIFSSSPFDEASPAYAMKSIMIKSNEETKGSTPPPFTSFSTPGSDNSEAIVFRTREGAVGVLTVLGFSDSPKRVRVAFKLVREEEKLPQQISNLTFGPIIERTVNDDRPGATEIMIDFDTGKLITPPSPEIANWEWTKANGIDAIGCTDTDVLGLLSTGGTVIVPTTEEAWLKPDVAQVRQIAIPLSATEQGGVAISGTEGFPSTYIFKTRGRTLGLLQIIGLTGDSSATKIRYRLIVDKDDPTKKAEEDFERVARLHMEAVSRMELKAARAFWLPFTELSKMTDEECLPNMKETNIAFENDPARMTTFSEWYRIGGYALARVTPPEEGEGRSIYLILGLSPNGWGIIQIDDIRQDESLSDKFEKYAESH